MTKQCELVYAGFVQLNEVEQSEVLSAIDQFRKKNSTEKVANKQSTIRAREAVMLGPVSTQCPCCGR